MDDLIWSSEKWGSEMKAETRGDLIASLIFVVLMLYVGWEAVK